MPLTAAHKALIDSMDDTDRALVVLYIVSGVDSNTAAFKVGASFLREFFPDVDESRLPNPRKARAFLIGLRMWIRGIHEKVSGESAGRAAEQVAKDAARTELPARDLGSIE